MVINGSALTKPRTNSASATASRPGEAAAGFLLTGRDFSALLNGREMPRSEALLFGALVGPIQSGRYWVDGTGNYGYEGIAVPAGNLYVMAAASCAEAAGAAAATTSGRRASRAGTPTRTTRRAT